MMQIQLSRLTLCSAVAALACATLVAQNPGSMPSQQQAPSAQQTPSASSPGDQPNTATAQNFGDQAFVSDAMKGNLAEVQLAQLAQQKSQSNDVKQFAQKMAADHTQMNEKWFQPEAKALNISAPSGPSKKDKKLMEKLQGLSGQEFDKEYMTAMLKDHQDDLKKYKEESDAAQDPNVKQIAQLGTKVISQHLELAQQVAKSHNIPVEEVSSK